MNVTISIDRLIVEDVAVDDRDLLRLSFERELARLVAEAGTERLPAGGALASMVAPRIEVAAGTPSVDLGRQIAGAVFGGMGGERR